MSDRYTFGDLGVYERDPSYSAGDLDVGIVYSVSRRRLVAVRRGATQAGGSFDFGPLGVLEVDPSYTPSSRDLVPVFSPSRGGFRLLRRGAS